MTVYRTYITMLVDGLVTYNDSVQDLYQMLVDGLVTYNHIMQDHRHNVGR